VARPDQTSRKPTKEEIMTKHLATTALAVLFATAVATTGPVAAHGVDSPAKRMSGNGSPYTVLDHPSKPCNLSVEAVANWGETSAHLPQACTYDE
jgi:hypothetical protein